VKEPIPHHFFSAIVIGLMIAASIPSAFSQSQALNGQIEGTVSDQNHAAVPNVVLTVINIGTGFTRTLTDGESGVYRFPLLPLGTYRITAEAPNFKKIVREGITLATGQTATVNLILETGEVQEVVTISSDTPVADIGKTDLGRVMNTREVQNLPLITRNPYNFALLQANVTGRPSRGFANPMVNANGYLRRVNYLFDGNTNTQADRSSIRLMLISDTYVSEIQLMTSGFAAEFGNTPGLIMNIVTPSGTNKISGSISYRFRRPSFYSRPFFYPSSEDIPDNKANNFTATIGGPIIKDRWHFYFGYENSKRDDKAAAARLLTIRPEDRAELIAAGLPASIFPSAIPFLETGPFYVFRTDAQLNDSSRLSVRLNHSNAQSKNFIQGGLNTLERAIDTFSTDYGLAVQLASYTPEVLNEFRFQYVQRTNPGPGGIRIESSGTGPSIVITRVANFGSPEGAAGTASTFKPLKIIQFQDNLTRTTGIHVVKFGGGFNFYDDTGRTARLSRYTFPSIAAYLAARNGTNLRSYASYIESFGDSEINYQATFWNFFLQDDWKLTRRLKLNGGLRYDLYRIPTADPTSQLPASRKFNVDQNNLAPRLGVVYLLREGKHPTILRAGAGIYFDQPPLAMYQRTLQNNGIRFFSFSFSGNNNGATTPSLNAPAFPATFSGSLPAGSVLPPQNIETIAPDFENMYALQANIQLEHAITNDLSFALGYLHSGGRHIPVYRNINLIPFRFLADGRPVFSSLVNSSTRFDPRFNNILMVESAGVSAYNALTLQLTQRLARGLQFSANYTISKATDDAPEQNLSATTIQNLILSDPFNRRLDKGYSLADQRHTFVMSLVAQPKFNLENQTLRYLFNHNQFGIITTANSGETFNLVSTDINNDGVMGSDRPIGIRRNSGSTPPQFNVDLRYSRFFNFTERYRLEIFGEFQNLFNINSIVQFNNVTVTTNATTGELVGGLPDFRALNQSTSQDSRQFQLGLKFVF
jgi:hypothetical protein